jgi:hypothetical protein
MLTRRVFSVLLVVAGAAIALGQGSFNPLDIIRWSTFKSGQYSETKKPLTRVINNEAEFQTYWTQNMGERPSDAPRGVDWNKEQLLAIHLGERNTGGFTVRVNAIKRTRAAEITVEYLELTPPKGSINTQAITSPWVLAKMDRSPGTISFKKSTRTAQTPIRLGGCCNRCTCSSGPDVEVLVPIHRDFPNPFGRPYERNVWWREYDCGEQSLISGYGVTIMRNLNDFGGYWMRHSGQQNTPYDREPIDWMREQLIGINLGKTAGPGYRMYVDSVERTRPNEITIRYTVIIPPVNPPLVTRVSSPYAVLRIERNTDNIVLVRRNFLPSSGGGCNCRCGRCYGG